MSVIAYHASHEQFAPSALLQYAVAAEKAGFSAIHSSDHFHPWSERQGQSGFSFAWLGAAMQATSLPFSLVCAPGQRYHPAIVAQALATLDEMFPGRISVELGSGEALNENITGDLWPHKEERNARLLECVQVIRRLLAGETVTHMGRVRVQEARLYTRPAAEPSLMVAALSEKTAAWAGSWADGLITVPAPPEQLQQIINAYRKNGGEGKPLLMQMCLSYARSYEDALEGAYDQWRTNLFAPDVLNHLYKPEQFDQIAANVSREEMKEKMMISSDPQAFIQQVNDYVDMGFEKIILHNVNRQQETFIQDFGEQVLPFIS